MSNTQIQSSFPFSKTVPLFFVLSFLFTPFFSSLLCRFSDLPLSTLRHAHAHKHVCTHTHSSFCTSPGTPGKGRAKMEMNSAMLQVATQICICNYPQKHMGSFFPLSLFLLHLSSFFSISFTSPRLLMLPFFCLYLWTPPSPPPCLSHTLSLSQRLLKWCLVGQLRWEVWACMCVCACVCVFMHMFSHVSVFMHASNTLHSLAYVHNVCVCVCLFMCVCVSIGVISLCLGRGISMCL